jgi:hypothetical protein
MARIAHDLLDDGYPFLMEKPMGINAPEVEAVAEKAARLNAFIAVPLAQRYAPFATRAIFGSTGRDRRAIQLGIALGCSILARPAAAASGTSARTGSTCSFT